VLNIFRYSAALTGTLIAAAPLSSCKPREGDETAARAIDSASRANTATQNDAAQPGAASLSDANIVALLDEANQADSTAGAYAVGKATSPEVKAFARLMMGEHHALRLQGQQLAKKLNVAPQPPANDPLKPAAESEMAALRAAPKGAQFDRVYIDQEVAIHKAVLDLAEQAHGAAQNPELKALIEKAQPIIERHRERAEKIQQKLGRPAA
jgi:putative membrane protein